MGKMNDWITDDNLILVEGWARDGLNNEQIAHNIGVNVKTLYDWKNKSSNFRNALKKGREVVDYEVENALLKSALSGNVVAQIFWLKNRKQKEWKDKIETPIDNKELSNVEKLLKKIEDEAQK